MTGGPQWSHTLAAAGTAARFRVAVCTREAGGPAGAGGSGDVVRATPTADGEIVGRLARGERAEFVRTIDGWHEIVTPDGSTGFVHGDCLSSMDIVAVLTRVVQSQQRQIEALERHLEDVEAR